VLDTVVAIGVLARTDEGFRPYSPLYGQFPADLDANALTDACTDRPALRKVGTRFAVLVPEGTGQWVLWLFAQVPPVTALQGLAERLVEVTRALRAAPHTGAGAGTAAGTPKAGDAIGLILSRVWQAEKRSPGIAAQLTVDAFIEAGLARAAVAMPLRGGKLRAPVASDTGLLVLADEIRLLARRHLAEDAQFLRLQAADLTEAGLDAGLIADGTGSEEIILSLPARDADGLALVLFDAPGFTDQIGRDADMLFRLATGARKPVRGRARVLRAGLAAAIGALAVWLVLPAPLMVQAPVTSIPLNARALSAPVGSFAMAVDVRVGDRVAAGDRVALLRAPDLEEQRASLAAEVAIETVAAQTALSQNDYGAYVMAQQRIEAAVLRLNRVEERIAALTITAPVAGRIAFAITPDLAGRFLPMGETVAVVHPQPEFGIQVYVARSDAPLLSTGMHGEVWFRGLPGATWPIETETPVSLVSEPSGTGEQLVLRARILGADQERLLGGLAGFARIEAGSDMRARVLGRHVIEFLRSKAWTWFGLTF